MHRKYYDCLKKSSDLFLLSLFFCCSKNVYANAEVINTSGNILQTLVALVFVVGLIIASVWLIKKTGYRGYSSSNLIQIDSCLALSNKEKLLLVRVGDEQMLIGVAPGFIGNIKNLDVPVTKDSIATSQAVSSVFSEKLMQIMKKDKSDTL